MNIQRVIDAYSVILDELGAKGPGVEDTPGRAARAMVELTSGMREPLEGLRVFDEPGADQMVLVGPLEFSSLCEHHLLPFRGHAVVGYIPQHGRILGLSKIPRIVRHCALALQNQERMCNMIADTLGGVPGLNPRGVGVLLSGVHSCMAARGVRVHGRMITNALRGAILEQPAARSEFLSLARPLLEQAA